MKSDVLVDVVANESVFESIVEVIERVNEDHDEMYVALERKYNSDQDGKRYDWGYENENENVNDDGGRDLWGNRLLNDGRPGKKCCRPRKKEEREDVWMN
jgi:hypothetical protein